MNTSPTLKAPHDSSVAEEVLSFASHDRSRFEVRVEEGCFLVHAERWVDGAVMRVGTVFTTSQYQELKAFSSGECEANPKLEIERKWRPEVPKDLPGLEAFVGQATSSHSIKQGYLVIDTVEVRLRRQDDVYFLTLKSDGGLVRKEVEIALSAEQFEDLWPATEGQRLEKMRSKHSIGTSESDTVVVEVDRFCGEHSGLIVVECEFANQQAAGRFKAPACFGTEVTESKEHKNRSLVIHGVPVPPLSGLSFSISA